MLDRLFMGAARKSADFSRCASGNIAMLAGLMLLPLTGLGGLGVDYYVASSAKERYDTAADAAALAAVRTAREVANSNGAMGAADPLAEGQAAAMRAFLGNAPIIDGVALPRPEISVTRDGLSFTARVRYSTTVNSIFGKLFNTNTYEIGGEAVAGQEAAVNYINLHLVLDVSSSMGIGADTIDQQKMLSVISCAFACHITGQGDTVSQVRARTDARLRIDVLRDAVTTSLDTLRRAQIAPDQYRVALHTFSSEPRTLIAINDPRASDLRAVEDVASRITMDRTGGGSIIQRALAHVASTLPPNGDGSRPDRRRNIVILITDGVETSLVWPANRSYHYWSGYRSFAPTSSIHGIQNLDPQLCEPIKQTGASMSVLRVEYVSPLGATGMAADAADYIRNVLLPLTEETIAGCASDRSRFLSANTSSEIGAAMRSLVQMALDKPRLTH